MKYFWNRVESKRLPGESLAAFAKRVKIPDSSLRAYQRGTVPQRTESYRHLAAKLGVDMYWLMDGWSWADLKQEAQRRGVALSDLPYLEERPFLESQGAYLQ